MPSLEAEAHPASAIKHWLDGPASLTRLPGGRINDTWLAGDRHVLQRVNPRVFADPLAVMRNLSKVLAHDATLLVAPRPTRDGQDCVVDAGGGAWRLFPRIEGRSFDVLPGALFGRAAQAFGAFQARMAGFRGALAPVIPGFHDLDGYLAALDAAPAGAVRERKRVDALRDAFPPTAKANVIHGDCKVGNLLFHQDLDEVVAVIDLDTVMLGDSAWDFGDLVRSAFAGDEESESPPPIAKAGVDALARGFAAGLRNLDQPVDRYAAAPAYMSFMLAVRFLADHLEGDVYFRVAARGDNLRRASGQLALARQFMDARKMIGEALDWALKQGAASG